MWDGSGSYDEGLKVYEEMRLDVSMGDDSGSKEESFKVVWSNKVWGVNGRR